MTCDSLKELLGAYVDGELDASSELQMRIHLADCPACSVAAQQLKQRQSMIRSGGLAYEAPAMLEQRIRNSLRPRKRIYADWRSWAALAATLFLVSSLSIRIVQRSTETTQLANEAVSNHVRALLTGHATDVASTDQHTVKPWFAGRLDFSPPVSDLAPQGFPLIGARLDYLERRPVAALVYQRRKHTIDLFVWPTGEMQASKVESLSGYNLLRWSSRGMAFVAVSDLNPSELEGFKNLLSR